MDIHFLKRLPLRNLNTEVDFRFYGRHLKKSIWRHNSDASRRFATKFGRLKQNHMRRTKHRSRSKSEVKFQYGGSPFCKTRSSFISAVNWDISSKFGMRTDFHLLKRMQSLALNTEVSFGLMAAILKNRYYVMTPPAIVWLRQNLACWCKITCRWLHMGQNWNKG